MAQMTVREQVTLERRAYVALKRRDGAAARLIASHLGACGVNAADEEAVVRHQRECGWSFCLQAREDAWDDMMEDRQAAREERDW